MPDPRLEFGIGDAGLPEIERRAQPLPVIGAQPLAGQTQLLASLRGALSTLGPVACLPLALAPRAGLLCFPPLTILSLLLLAVDAFALRGASALGIALTLGIATLLAALPLGGSAPLPLGIAFTLGVASLFRPLLANGAVPFALDGPLAFAARLPRFGLAVAFNSAWGTFRATGGTVDTRLFRLRRAWRIHLALWARASAGGPAHATRLAASRWSATPILSAALALR